MPKDMSHYTALARRAVGDHVRAAVPASRRSTNTWDNAVLAAVPWVPPRTTIGPQVLVFDDAAVDEHRFRFLHLGIGPRIERHPLEDVSYERNGMAIETRLRIGSHAWYIHGWYERELRDLLRTLGHANGLGDLT